MKQRNFQVKQIKAGFSLVEMLAVILIIAVFLGIGINIVRDMSKGKSISSAVAIAEGVFDQARVKALASSSFTRVLIHNDPSEPERFCRYMAVAKYGTVGADGGFAPADPESGDGEWVVTSSGVLLPEKAYFDLRGSSSVGGNLAPSEFSISLPGDNPAAISCFYYEFNGEGLISQPGPGAGFVIARGNLPPGASEARFELDGGTPVDVGGFVIWRLGNSSRIQDKSQISY